MRLIVLEGATRAAYQAKRQGESAVSLEHLEKVLTQFVSSNL